MGWDALQNGTLLDAAEAEGFNVFVTGDRNIEYQQNLAARTISIVAITRNNWPLVSRRVEEIIVAIAKATKGSYHVVDCSPPVDSRGSELEL